MHLFLGSSPTTVDDDVDGDGYGIATDCDVGHSEWWVYPGACNL
jgi:hypothetical protein